MVATSPEAASPLPAPPGPPSPAEGGGLLRGGPSIRHPGNLLRNRKRGQIGERPGFAAVAPLTAPHAPAPPPPPAGSSPAHAKRPDGRAPASRRARPPHRRARDHPLRDGQGKTPAGDGDDGERRQGGGDRDEGADPQRAGEIGEAERHPAADEVERDPDLERHGDELRRRHRERPVGGRRGDEGGARRQADQARRQGVAQPPARQQHRIGQHRREGQHRGQRQHLDDRHAGEPLRAEQHQHHRLRDEREQQGHRPEHHRDVADRGEVGRRERPPVAPVGGEHRQDHRAEAAEDHLVGELAHHLRPAVEADEVGPAEASEEEDRQEVVGAVEERRHAGEPADRQSRAPALEAGTVHPRLRPAGEAQGDGGGRARDGRPGKAHRPEAEERQAGQHDRIGQAGADIDPHQGGELEVPAHQGHQRPGERHQQEAHGEHPQVGFQQGLAVEPRPQTGRGEQHQAKTSDRARSTVKAVRALCREVVGSWMM